MKRAFLFMVVPALLVALGFAQTPAASMNTDQTKIKGCLAGSDGNYTVVEDNTGHIYKITTSTADLKPHVGHDVALIGHKASGASSAAADNNFAVTELNMISEHCAAAAAAPVGSISTSAETTVAPAVAAAVPAATISAPAETAVTPAAAPAAPAVTISIPAETIVTPPAAAAAPAATVTTPAETAVTPAATPATPAATISTPAETTVTPPAAPAAPAATISTPGETAVTPAVAAVHATRMPAGPRRRSATPAAAPRAPAVTADTSSETVSTPDAATTVPAATASSSSETDAATPAAVPTTPTAPARRGSLWLLIGFAVVVILLGILAPSLSRWRKRKSLERTGAPNLSFTRDASSDKAKSVEAEPRKVA
jgi:hypothetical protein